MWVYYSMFRSLHFLISKIDPLSWVWVGHECMYQEPWRVLWSWIRKSKQRVNNSFGNFLSNLPDTVSFLSTWTTLLGLGVEVQRKQRPVKGMPHPPLPYSRLRGSTFIQNSACSLNSKPHSILGGRFSSSLSSLFWNNFHVFHTISQYMLRSRKSENVSFVDRFKRAMCFKRL